MWYLVQKRAISLFIGHVVGVYIDDRYIDDGMVNTGAMQPIARMGYMEYSVVKLRRCFQSIDQR
ncbi:MAG: hypothetical protein CM1200mP18_17010 [Gammaproteobacteria bacterium]|nr:MAG: hypothetical protein CM1200mP18_17010 [Gammaproteobacteria bacterium]